MPWQVFNRYAARYDAWFREEPGQILFQAEVEAVMLLFKKLRPPTLEVGVGSGAFAAALGITVGVDPAPGVLQIARASGVPVIRAMGESLPFSDRLFGGVLLIVTLCFAEKPATLLPEAARVLRPDGSILVGDIIKDSPWGRFYAEKKAAGHPFYRHAIFYTVAELLDLFEKAGLEATGFSSTLTQPPSQRPRPERAFEGIVPNASFVCLLGSPAGGAGRAIPGQGGKQKRAARPAC